MVARWQWAEGSQRHLCVSELMMGDLICCLPTRLFILGLEKAEDLCAPGPHLFQTVCEEAGGRRAGRGGGRGRVGRELIHPPADSQNCLAERERGAGFLLWFLKEGREKNHSAHLQPSLHWLFFFSPGSTEDTVPVSATRKGLVN